MVWLFFPAWDAVKLTLTGAREAGASMAADGAPSRGGGGVGGIYPFVVTDPTDLGATTLVAPGLVLDNFLPVPDAEFPPFYPSVLKLVVRGARPAP